MKWFMGVFLVVFLGLANPVLAIDSMDVAGAGFSDLSDTQKAEIIRQVATLKNNNANPTSTAKQVGEWVEIGTNIGKGLAGAAHELGVQVNEFAKTDVGKMVSFLIVWHFFGTQVIHILAAFVVLVVGIYSIRYLALQYQEETRLYDENNLDMFKRNRLKSVKRSGLSGDMIIFLGILTVCTVGASVGILASI